MASCKKCKSKNLIVDTTTGNLECSQCGIVQDFDNYEQQTFNATGPIGTNVRLGHYDYSYHETKIYLAQKVVSDILYKLDLENRVDEVTNMIKIITQEEYGSGNWFNVLVGACVYVVMRKTNKWLPLTSLCDTIGCDNYELGRMVYRVIDHLDLKLPDFDIVGLYDRVIKELLGCKGNIGKDKISRMVKQGIFLIQCMIKWYVTTGRRPVPVVVAVVVFISELNDVVDVGFEDLASQLNVVVVTCKLRYKELLKKLVEVARICLPWGKDVNVKNIMKNAPIVIQYMEIKSKSNPTKEIKNLEEVGLDLDGLVSDCLNRDEIYYLQDFGYDDNNNNNNNNKSGGSVNWEIEDLEKLNISPECLSTIYLKYLDEYSEMKSSMVNISEKRKDNYDFLMNEREYWSGNSELSKKLFVDKILEKDIGLNDAMPKSFIDGCLKTKKRKEKIKAAKVRIEKIMRPSIAENGESQSESQLVRKRKVKKVEIDWEDFVIETLLLHDVKEEEIEKGDGSGRHSYDSDYERGGRREREGSWRRRGSRDRKGLSRERDVSPYRRSRSRGHDDRVRSRSPRSRSSHGRNYREDSYDDDRDRHDRSDRRRDRDDYRHHEHYSTVPSATVVVKGLSQKTTEEDLYQMLAEWGPLRHVRVIKERNSGVSRGFAFIDFPTTGSARTMMEKIGDEGLVVDGRKLFFEYSKPTGGGGGSVDGSSRSGHMNHRSTMIPSDWMCTICGCVNFARRTSCFQCNEPRTEDAPLADMSSSNAGKKGDMGPTHVLVVRGLDENADEEMLRYEFSKHSPIKDLRLVRDKFTHVSRGFAFVHFHSIEDARKALEATNGTTLEKNGQILRVAYAKSILGAGTGASSSSHSSSLAAAAIEAAAFAQQYDAVGWAPKEYNPDEKQSNGKQDEGESGGDGKDGCAPQSGFVWDEGSGYYYDAASGFYYDGNTGLYYDGNNGIWYTYDHHTQQYVPCDDNNNNKKEKEKENQPTKAASAARKVVISAPAATTTSLPDAVQAAAAAAIAAEKKEKEKMKEIRLASKSSILASKKKMSNVLSMWKQRSHESQPPRVLDSSQQQSLPEKEKEKNNSITAGAVSLVQSASVDHPQDTTRPVAGGTLRGVIRGSGTYVTSTPTEATVPFRTDASALGSYTPPTATVSGRRRFSEAPVHVKEQQPQTGYRDRAAERRSLYGSSTFGEDLSDVGGGDPNGIRRDSMPFPPGVGGGTRGGGESSSYEVITSDKAIDENNVGNRMLRNMGWQEGAGLGKDGSGMVEPVQAQATEKRAGLGSQPKKSLDPSLEVQAGDSYRTLIQKKALARFREMS